MMSASILSSSRCTGCFFYVVIILPIKDQVCISNLKLTSDIVHLIPYVVLDISMSRPVDYP